jgi:hypothetical protein
VKQIARMQNHVDIVLLSKTHHFMEGLPAVVAPMKITFIVADMTISGYKNSDRIQSCF